MQTRGASSQGSSPIPTCSKWEEFVTAMELSWSPLMTMILESAVNEYDEICYWWNMLQWCQGWPSMKVLDDFSVL